MPTEAANIKSPSPYLPPSQLHPPRSPRLWLVCVDMDLGGRPIGIQLAARYGLQQGLVHLHVGAEVAPPIQGAGRPEESRPTELVVPGQGWEATLVSPGLPCRWARSRDSGSWGRAQGLTNKTTNSSSKQLKVDYHVISMLRVT